MIDAGSVPFVCRGALLTGVPPGDLDFKQKMIEFDIF